MLSDESGATSSKRVIAFLCGITLCATLVLNCIYPNAVNPSDVLIHAIEGLAGICIAGSTVDKFSKAVEKTTPEEKVEDANEKA